MHFKVTNSAYLNYTDTIEIEKIIKSLKNGKSLGPNRIPTSILKYCVDILSEPLSKLINLSFDQGIFPELLKTAKVIPVFKKGDPLLCNNYRPISLLSIFSKILEKCFHKRIYSFLEKHQLIYKRQFGFRNKHSTLDALVNLIETTKLQLDEGNFVSTVFIDMQKAFDTVDHEILLSKLNFYGIRGCVNNWLRTFLCGRKQYVSLSNYQSELDIIKCGVPQGSTLGPLLFLIYLNDLNEIFTQVTANHFADDTYLTFANENTLVLERVMNEELKILVEWLKSNKLSLNENKTELIIFKPPTENLTSDEVSIKLNNHTLTPCKVVKYLGIVIDENLNWNAQIETLTTKLSQANGILSKLRHYIPLSLRISVYYSIFYPHILYGSLVWQYSTNTKLQKIYTLQKRCIRILTFSDFLEHTNPLFISLKLLKLCDVLQGEVLKYFFRLHMGQLPPIISTLFTYNNTVHNHCTRSSSSLHIPSFNTINYGKNSLRYKGASDWNNFYKDLTNNKRILTLSSFKTLFKLECFKTYENGE